ncbi:activated protein kinase catalytic subunit alpha-1 [Seminavis robusta]|uniref:cGMP-dependent protein kinase n=1 Tax=Seminavis robusta TaxID=568900 RepID=A0A9N8D5Z1_9STRA|nr:activated protein kinase catalytic subunit alpha-1 [Seminavis robusta]|eukprot:Sro9_g007000.1 activated protein kinase catalytic subunit alpha-1 (813) ;mRNA; r:9252-11788
MPEKSIDDLVMTPQEAAKVLKELVSMGKVRVPDIEVALASVRRRRMEKKDAKKDPTSSSSSKSSEDDGGRVKRGKGRQKVRAQAVNVHGKSLHIPAYDKSDEAVKFLTNALTSDSNFLFSSLSPDELSLLINAMAPHDVPSDTIIIKQGDIGDYFYVMEEGRVDFQVDGNSVGNCGRGASFGELALLYDSPRAATCVADTDCKLWKVDQHTFRYMLAKQQANQNKQINAILVKVPFLSELEDTMLSKIIDALTTIHFQKGEFIFKKGDIGDMFYILEKGTAKVHDIGFGDTKFDDINIESGAYFGERALLTGEPRAANVSATSDCVCLALSRDSFEATLGPLQALIDRAMTKRTLLSIPSFGESYIEPHEIDRFLDLMEETSFKKGEIIMEEGKPCKPALHILQKGRVTIVSNKGEINNLQNGGHFGEATLQLKTGDPGQATITAIEDTTCRLLTKKSIEGVIGSVIRLGQARALINQREQKISVKYKSLKKIRILGIGTFGKVWLAVDKTNNGKVYALKMMDKKQCIEYKQHEGVIREKNILANIDHPFLLKMYASYQDDAHLMMLLDLIQGGELFSVLHTDTRDGVSNADAVFYAACVLEGLGHLHERNIAYRDLKPENALIDSKGYCIVVDYGFAKVVTSKTFTLCGTPEYLAPEIILSKGHNKGVDYWAFGILIYEMLVGQSPFYCNDQMRLFKKIVQGKFAYPASRPVSKAADDLIQRLLQRHQSKRLGNLKGGHVDVQKHPWFSDVDVKKLLKRELRAPWKPQIKDALDASNFDDYSSMEKEESSGRKPKLSSKEQAVFKEFGEYV